MRRRGYSVDMKQVPSRGDLAINGHRLHLQSRCALAVRISANATRF